MQREYEDLSLHGPAEGVWAETRLPKPGRAPRDVQPQRLEARRVIPEVRLEARLARGAGGQALYPFLLLAVHVDL